MGFNSDFSTKILKQALDILFLSSPFKTSMGILLGIILGEFTPIFFPFFVSVQIIAWLSLGVFIVNLKALFSKRKLSPAIEEAFTLLEEARKAGIPEVEVKQRFRLLIQKCVDNIELNQQSLLELEKIKKQLNRNKYTK